MRSRSTRARYRAIIAGTALAAAAVGTASTPATAAPRHPESGFTVRAFPAVGSESKPDDLTRLGNAIYVAFQNGVGPKGEASPTGVTESRIQQYSLSGEPGASWAVTGKVDGLTADPAHRRLLVTTNEDGNSSFHTLQPGSRHPLRTYTYSGLASGGGTDAISLYRGQVIVSASNPAAASAPASYRVRLAGSTAKLTPLFADNAHAVLADGPHAGKTVALALTDPDSNEVVPSASPRFKQDFVLDGQADQQLVFARHLGARNQRLEVLQLSQPVNDTAFVTCAGHTIWITDPTSNKVYAVSGFRPHDVITAAVPAAGSFLGRLNLATGAVAPIGQLSTIHPAGLLVTR
ncbi:MAG TPA: hypothetical protein VIG76_13570 [Amnibacterium sp.]|uniref:hypothetical protein n=1 Tax=Amnibacterium sp. TaxID=1872496 RepID=UPI002F94C5BE